jgi:sensor histidine kinase regulating citrate/malate metabolism
LTLYANPVLIIPDTIAEIAVSFSPQNRVRRYAMIKSLAGKAIIPVAMAVTGFVIVCCILLYTVVKSDMTHTATLHASSLANLVAKSTHYSMLTSDRKTLRSIIENVGEQHEVEHVRIFNKKGLIEFSSNPKELNHLVNKKTAGCIGCHAGPIPTAELGAMQKARTFINEKGREVLAITEPIYNEPECYNAACHFHTSGQKVLGTLDVGLSRKPLRDALATMRGRMIVFTLLVLILSVGGVAALLRISILNPVKMLTRYCNDLADGKPGRKIPKFEGELESLAQSIKRVENLVNKERVPGPGGNDGDGH